MIIKKSLKVSEEDKVPSFLPLKRTQDISSGGESRSKPLKRYQAKKEHFKWWKCLQNISSEKKKISSVGSVRKMAPSSSSAFYLLERLRDLGKCIFDMSTQLKLNNSESSEDAKPVHFACLWVMDWLGLVLGTSSKKRKSKLFSSSIRSSSSHPIINRHLIFRPGFVQKVADS